MSCQPSSGTIGAYQQIPITIICRSEVSESSQKWVTDWANLEAAEEEGFGVSVDESEPYKYTIQFDFSIMD